MSGTTRVSRYQKGKTRKVKTNLDLLEQEIVSGSGISWAICKSAPHPRQPRQHPTTQFFTGQMPFLSPNQQRQSTELSANPQRFFPKTMAGEIPGEFQVAVFVTVMLLMCMQRATNLTGLTKSRLLGGASELSVHEVLYSTIPVICCQMTS